MKDQYLDYYEAEIEESMMIKLPLDKMSTKEKIQTIEEIWNNLLENTEDIPSPDWHKQILKDRENKVRDNKEEFIDWDSAKKNIRDEI